MAIMIEDASVFGAGFTLEDTWKIANTLPITPLFLAEVSGEGDRLFGIKSIGCDINECNEPCETSMSPSARTELWRAIYQIAEFTEDRLRWTLTKRFITDKLTYTGIGRVMLSRGGVIEADVEEIITSLSDVYPAVSYSASVGQVVQIVDAGPPNNVYEVYVPRDVAPDPERVMFRKQNDSNPILWVDINGYPKIGTGPSGESCWVLPVNPNQAPGLNLTDVLEIVDCRYSFFDAPDQSGLTCGGDIEPVYPGTYQKIPYFKKETLDTGVVRYWVYHRAMIHPAFLGRIIRLDEGEFWKFIDEVEFACFYKQPRLAEVTFYAPNSVDGCTNSDTEACKTTTSYACTTIIDARQGIVGFELVDLVLDDLGNPQIDPNTNKYVVIPKSYESSMGIPVSVKVFYRTDPQTSGIDLRASIAQLRAAIAAATAAIVPLKDCGCNKETGYFAEMSKKSETRVENRFTGTSIILARYGDQAGFQVLWNALLQAPRMVKAVIF